MQQPTVSVTNLCHLIKLLSLFSACVMCSLFVVLLYTIFSSLCYLLTFYVSMHRLNGLALHTKRQKSHSSLIVRTHSAPIDLSNSAGVSDHRAILTWGDRGICEQCDILYILRQTSVTDSFLNEHTHPRLFCLSS